MFYERNPLRTSPRDQVYFLHMILMDSDSRDRALPRPHLSRRRSPCRTVERAPIWTWRANGVSKALMRPPALERERRSRSGFGCGRSTTFDGGIRRARARWRVRARSRVALALGGCVDAATPRSRRTLTRIVRSSGARASASPARRVAIVSVEGAPAAVAADFSTDADARRRSARHRRSSTPARRAISCAAISPPIADRRRRRDRICLGRIRPPTSSARSGSTT